MTVAWRIHSQNPEETQRLSAPKSGKMSSSVAPGGPFTLKGLMNETSLRNLKYTNMFTQMDGDGDGLINAEELRAGLVKLGVKRNKNQVTQLLLQFNQGQATHTFHRARYAVYGICICRPPARDTRTHSLYIHAARTHFAACTLQARHRWRNPTSSTSRSTSSTR